ncbi:MAG TPA: response regulator [Candidatus Binataceae bacterium]|nr:response regulator [Candidatus Binataceae bacterium]
MYQLSDPSSFFAKASDVNPAVSTRRVLIVDDNQDAVEALALLLEAQGHEVRKAFQSATALEIAAHFEPEVAIVDLGLPGMNGYELARLLRERSAAILLIALSGRPIAPNDERRGVFGHALMKPLDFAELQKLLARP